MSFSICERLFQMFLQTLLERVYVLELVCFKCFYLSVENFQLGKILLEFRKIFVWKYILYEKCWIRQLQKSIPNILQILFARVCVLELFYFKCFHHSVENFLFFSMIYHLHINLKKYYTLLYLGKLKNNIKQCIGKYIGFALIRS